MLGIERIAGSWRACRGGSGGGRSVSESRGFGKVEGIGEGGEGKVYILLPGQAECILPFA